MASSSSSSSPPKREDVMFASHGSRCAAWFYPAPPAKGQSAVIVLGHGLGGIKEMGLDAHAELFQRAGYACLAFDYRHFGASEGQPRQLLDIAKQRQDWNAAIAYARSREEVDPERVAIFGSSFGGGHVLEIAKADPRVKAVISQCPFTHGIASALCCGVTPTPWFVALAARDLLFGCKDGTKDGKMVTIPLVGKQGSVALLNGHDAYDGYLRLVPEGLPSSQQFKNEVGARFIPQILLDYPGAAAASVQAPIFFAVCQRDSCAPVKQTLAYARQAPKGTIKEYDCGHFDIYLGEWFDKASKDYVQFLHEKLPVAKL